VTPNHAERIRAVWPEGPRASRLTLELDAGGPVETRIKLRDLRVQGQSAALARYVERFPFRWP
jgi:hypothetical protein